MTRILVLLCMFVGCGDKLTDASPVGDTAGDADTDTDADSDADTDTDTDQGVTFVPHLVDSPPGPVFANVGDVNGDGSPDLVVSSLGLVTEADVPPGVVSLYTLGSGLDQWNKTDIIPSSAGVRYPNHPTLHDLDGDGDLDVVVPSGGKLCGALPAVDPCGAIQWMENNGGAWVPHIVTQGGPAYYNSAQIADIDGDGLLDLVTSAEVFTATVQASQLLMFRGSGVGTFQNTPLTLETGGPWPALEDVDGDGDLDVLLGERYSTASFSWYAFDGGGFTRHVIADDLGEGFAIRTVEDLYGDGVRRVVATNHTNTASPEEPDTVESQVVAFEIPADPTQRWTTRDKLSEGIVATPDVPLIPLGAPGTFAAGDADGDGDLDLVVAGASDPTVWFLEQTGPAAFATRILRGDLPGSGGTQMADFDGDGDLEMVVVGERNDAVFVLEKE